MSPVDELHDRLRRAGWSCGDGCASGDWLVTGANGETVIGAGAPKQTEAWRVAVEQAAAVGMLA
jgi:hypothetical protein